MSKFRLYSPEVVINNEPLNIIPNSFEYNDGLGEDIVSVIANGTNTENVISTDLTTKKSSMKFSVASTAENAQLVRNLKVQPGRNVIKATDSNADFTRTMTSGTLIISPTIQLQAEGVIELEFEGNTLA